MKRNHAGTATAVKKKNVVKDEPLYEVINGVKVEVPPMGAWAGIVATRLATQLNVSALAKRRGEAAVEVLFRMKPGMPKRRPDIAFISKRKWTKGMFGPNDPAEYKVVPDIAVEVNSPTNSASEIEDKIQEYLESGVKLVWVVYPTAGRIHVYSSPTESRILRRGDVLDAGDVIPEFQLPLADLFRMD